MHPRAGHGVTHFKKNRRAKKASIFSSPFSPSFLFLSLSLSLAKKRRVAKERGTSRRSSVN